MIGRSGEVPIEMGSAKHFQSIFGMPSWHGSFHCRTKVSVESQSWRTLLLFHRAIAKIVKMFSHAWTHKQVWPSGNMRT